MTTREDKLRVWEDLTRELWPHASPDAAAHCVELVPIAWLSSWWSVPGSPIGETLMPGWVDRRVWPQIPHDRFDFSKVYAPEVESVEYDITRGGGSMA